MAVDDRCGNGPNSVLDSRHLDRQTNRRRDRMAVASGVESRLDFVVDGASENANVNGTSDAHVVVVVDCENCVVGDHDHRLMF